jgi:hypothetical protein
VIYCSVQELNGRLPRPTRLVAISTKRHIATFPNSLGARTRGVLEDAGICTTVAGEDAVSVLNIGTAIGPVKLLVREEDCVRAERVSAVYLPQL